MTIKALLFDFGGTIDTNGVHWSEQFWMAYDDVLNNIQKQDFELAYLNAESIINADSSIIKPEYTFLETIKIKVKLQFEFLLGNKLLDGEEADAEKKVVEHCYGKVKQNIKAAELILKNFQKQYKLALVSNFYGNIATVLSEFGIDKYFDTIVDSKVVGVSKPDPEIFNIAIKNLNNVLAVNSVVIGDSYDRDIQPAKLLGCKTIWLDGKSWYTPANTDDADFTIKSFEELPQIIEKL